MVGEIAHLRAHISLLTARLETVEQAELMRRVEVLEEYLLTGRGVADAQDYQLPPVAHGVDINAKIPGRFVRNGAPYSHHEHGVNRAIWKALMETPHGGATWSDLIRVLGNCLDFARHQRAMGKELPRK